MLKNGFSHGLGPLASHDSELTF